MATYIMLGKYSSDALRGLSADRTERASQLIKKYGGEIKYVYALMGDKDLMIIVDFPGTAQVMKASITISRLTGIAFSTSEAIEVSDFDKMISDL